MADKDNGNVNLLKPNSSSNEDLSEYTDADESISSAPTEFLSEFLSAVLLKDYATALKYCKLILQYEPNNVTAKDFYPLIIQKLKQEFEQNQNNSDNSDSDVEDECSDDDEDEENEDDPEEEVEGEISGGSGEADAHSDGTTASYSSLEDDEPGVLNQLAALAEKYHMDNADLGNGNAKIEPSTLSMNKNWELSNMTEKGDNIDFKFNCQTSSDSESPTEPISQKLIAQLRAKVVPSQY